jgi:Fic family protein
VPERQLLITPAVEAQLTERHRKMLLLVVQGDELTSRKGETLFSVTRETANQDFGRLLEMGLLRKVGRGRSTR